MGETNFLDQFVNETGELEIAGVHGYENSSKFAAAFFDVMGMKPNEYRRNMQEE